LHSARVQQWTEAGDGLLVFLCESAQ